MKARLFAAAAALLFAETTLIRLGYPGVGADNRLFTYGGIASIVHAAHYVEAAFAHDPDIKVQWTLYRGAGPALNEALAAGQLDVAAGLGDLAAIVGRANGLKTKWIATSQVHDPIYLAVQPGSGIGRIEDLQGRRISQFKGTNLQLAANRVLAAHGLTERNVRFINLDFGNAIAALVAGDIDGSFGGVELLDLRRRGVVEVPYTTKDDDLTFGPNAAFYVTEAFEARHPDLVQRVVLAIIRAAKWGADEANREQVFVLYAKSGISVESFRENFANETLVNRLNPLLDPFVLARYRDQAQHTQAYGLTRKPVDVDSWVERKYLDQALATLGLQDYWPGFDADGHKVTDGKVERTHTAAQ